MVGFVYDPTSKVEEEEPTQPSELKKSIDPLDFSLSEIDDLSFSFADSLIDFDSLKDWIEENPETYMADLNPDPGMVDSVKAEFGAVEKCTEMGEEGFCKEAIVEGSIGNLGSLIEEEMGKVSLEGVLDGPTVGVNENEEKGGEIATVKCEDESYCEMMGVIGDGLKSREIATAVCEDGNNCELMGAIGDGVKSNAVVCVDEIGSKSGDSSTVGKNVSKSGEMVGDGDESDGDSESESASSSSASSSSSSSSEDDDEDNGDEEEKNGVEEKEKGEAEGETDMEEGEIRGDSLGEEMVAWSGEDDEDDIDGVKAGPILSKNELKFLPPVPQVNVSLQPYHQTLPVGVVLSILGAQLIVEGVEKHNPLNEGSILWITESRSPLGLVDEIFGPVKNPYYVVRYNSDSEVPPGIQQGTLISFVPEFVSHVLNNNNNLYKKGYDASGENDEELSDDMEFSDDEKEAEYKRMQKMSKRGTNDQNVRNRKKDKKKFKNRGGNWKSDQPSATQPPAGASPSPREQKQHFVPPVMASQDHGNCSRSSGLVQGFASGPGLLQGFANGPRPAQGFANGPGPAQGFAGGPGLVPKYPQLAQAPGFSVPSNGAWKNGIPCQQPPSMGFPTNHMPWLQQNHHPQQPYRMPFPNAVPFQQQFGASSNLPSNFVLGGQSNFSAGPAFAPSWPASMNQSGFNQPQASMGLQAQHTPPPSINVGENGILSNGFQPPRAIPGNAEGSQNFNPGAHFGRGGGRQPFRGRGGGRFGGGRGRQQSK